MTLVLLLPAAGHGQRLSESGLRTGNAHLVVVTSTPNRGLEAGIPRDSWYAKGIALDMQGQWDQSRDAYRKAREEFKKQLAERPRWAKMIRGWLAKATFQVEQSRLLRSRRYYFRYRRHVDPYRTVARHNKWLAIRAFTGRRMPKLRDQILDEYRKIIRNRSYDDNMRVLLAALLHEVGRPGEARRVFAKVRRADRGSVAKAVAYYYTAAGDTDQAFKYLEKAVRYRSGDRSYILRSNDFDRLRPDPRFRKLVGEP